jgi:hypothetical protein
MSKNKDYTSTTVSASLRQYDNSVGASYQVPFSLSPGFDRLRKMCLPYVGGGTPNGALVFSRGACGAIPLAKQYTEIMEETNPNGVYSAHIGSLYLQSRTYETIGALIGELTYEGSAGVGLELKKFTNGESLASFVDSSADSNHSYVNQSNVTVSSAGWYDIYLSGSIEGSVSSIRGIYYSYKE